jgi:chemotaxis protein methyltransferase CheR
MVLAEACGLDRVRLRGVDCRPTAIRKASDGVYPAADAAALPSDRRARWFDEGKTTVQVDAALRKRAQWHVGDAFELDPAMRADVVLCRNLAIYLRAGAVQRLWHSIAERLRPGGLLMVGKAERITSIPSLRWIGPCLYRKSDDK